MEPQIKYHDFEGFQIIPPEDIKAWVQEYGIGVFGFYVNYKHMKKASVSFSFKEDEDGSFARVIIEDNVVGYVDVRFYTPGQDYYGFVEQEKETAAILLLDKNNHAEKPFLKG